MSVHGESFHTTWSLKVSGHCQSHVPPAAHVPVALCFSFFHNGGSSLKNGERVANNRKQRWLSPLSDYFLIVSWFWYSKKLKVKICKCWRSRIWKWLESSQDFQCWATGTLCGDNVQAWGHREVRYGGEDCECPGVSENVTPDCTVDTACFVHPAWYWHSCSGTVQAAG